MRNLLRNVNVQQALYIAGLLTFIGLVAVLVVRYVSPWILKFYDFVYITGGPVCLLWLPIMLLCIPLGIAIGISKRKL